MQPLKKGFGGAGGKGRMVFHPNSLHAAALQETLEGVIHDFFGGNLYIRRPCSPEGLGIIFGSVITDVEYGAGRRLTRRLDHLRRDLIGSPQKREYGS